MKIDIYGVRDHYATLAIALLLILTAWGDAMVMLVSASIALFAGIVVMRRQ